MMRRPLIALYILSIFLFSCRATKTSQTTLPATGSAKDYIETFKGLAVSEMKRTGVPASITLAQGMIESGMGKSRLAAEANNHFGIKCHDNWRGPTIRYNDDRRNECFRKYKTPGESYRDHSDFLRSTPRYSSLFDLEPTDYRGWAKGLKKAGYATNPDYANMLIKKIDDYGLHKYDNATALSVKTDGIPESPAIEAIVKDTITLSAMDITPVESTSYLALPARVKENNRIQYIIVNERDTKSSIEKELGLLPWELQRYNELQPGFSLTPGQMLYIQPKRDKAEAGKENHIAKDGETMYMISQIYGIKLKQLYIMNLMKEGGEPEAGQRIWLRKVRPVE